MRMWMLNPKVMCMQHVVGEHGEIHKHRNIFVRKIQITGYIKSNAVEPLSMKTRHDELELELKERAIASGRTPSNSPYVLPSLSHLPIEHLIYRVDTIASAKLLYNRCDRCRELMDKLSHLVF